MPKDDILPRLREVVLIKFNLLDVLGPDVGLLGELAVAKFLPGVARGDVVAMLVEGVFSAQLIEPEDGPPSRRAARYVTAQVDGRWPLHKSWFVPALGPDGFRLFLDPPRGLVKYIGRDDGEFAAILKTGLDELAGFVLNGSPAPHVVGVEHVAEEERKIARMLAEAVAKLDEDEAAEVIETLRQVDLLLEGNGGIYHIEVKTSAGFRPNKVRKKLMALEARQRVLQRLGMRPALAYVVPREDWNVEVYLATDAVEEPPLGLER